MTDYLKSANSAKTGISFKDARLEQKLTIEDVADKTLINIKYIKAIESGDYSDFPSEGFARAYFIKYQDFLGIQCDFPSIYVSENRKDQIVKKSVAVFNKSFKKFVLAIGLVLCILVASILIRTLLDDINTEKKDQYETDISKESLSQIITSVNKNKAMEYVQEDIPNTLLLMTENQLQLTFSDECWIELYSGDTLIESQLFQSGDSYTIFIEKPYKIIVGNANAVTGAYNGVEIDFITNANRLNVNTIIFNNE